ncbi:MAG TPA: CoA transferase [Thermodesulfobacteriota bacterium]|nr:CoA transferase [Thermodesulfobacteriota bacterium]
MAPQALAGTLAIELGGFAAGPMVGKYLANHGAEVIRIESRAHLDGFRTHYPPFKDNVPGVDRAAMFAFYNDGKRSVTLNLKHPRGIELARRLVARADVLIENYTPGTIARLGLGYETVSRLNPRLVMLSTCNQGQTGPHAQHPGFGSHLTSLSGFSHLLGEAGRTPVLLYGPYIDYIAVGYGVIAVLAALARREATGRGCYIDLSQYESGLQFMGPALLDYQANGRVMSRAGNRDPVAVPHGTYPCRGDDVWCALSVWDDDEWRRFGRALGEPAWAADPRFRTVEGRKAHEEELDRLVAAWTRQHACEEVVARLRAEGLCAAPVNTIADLFADPQLAHRRFWRRLEHPVIGPIHCMAPPFILSDTPAHLTRPGPCLGADNGYVLGELLGLSPDEIAALEQDGALK